MIAEGKWVGGWFGENSYFSTYPEPHEIFIEDEHHMDDLGKIGDQVSGSAGVWLALKGHEIVEWQDTEDG